MDESLFHSLSFDPSCAIDCVTFSTQGILRGGMLASGTWILTYGDLWMTRFCFRAPSVGVEQLFPAQMFCNFLEESATPTMTLTFTLTIQRA